MPSEYIVQDMSMANPPTLFLPLADMAQRVASARRKGMLVQAGDLAEDAAFLKAGMLQSGHKPIQCW